MAREELPRRGEGYRRQSWDRGDLWQAAGGFQPQGSENGCGVIGAGGIIRPAAPRRSWAVGLKRERLAWGLGKQGGNLRPCFSPCLRAVSPRLR